MPNPCRQTVAELVKRLSTGDLQTRDLPRVLLREVPLDELSALGHAVLHTGCLAAGSELLAIIIRGNLSVA